eukprot:5052939-Karenia_brevis.AAC.1
MGVLCKCRSYKYAFAQCQATVMQIWDALDHQEGWQFEIDEVEETSGGVVWPIRIVCSILLQFSLQWIKRRLLSCTLIQLLHRPVCTC